MAVPVSDLHGPSGDRIGTGEERSTSHSAPLGTLRRAGCGRPCALVALRGRELRVALDGVDADHQAVGGVPAARQLVELLDEVADAGPELVGPVDLEACVPDEGP